MTDWQRAREIAAKAAYDIHRFVKPWEYWQTRNPARIAHHFAEVDAIITALRCCGYIVAPRVATEEMVNAAVDCHAANAPYESPFGPDGSFSKQHTAMLEAWEKSKDA